MCVAHLYRCQTSGFLQLSAGGTGVTLGPVPTKTARSRSDIKGKRPFDVPASISFHVMFPGWDVANPRNHRAVSKPFVFNFLYCTVVASCIYLFSTSWSWSTVHLMVSGGFRFDDIHGSDCLLGVPHILINLGSHFCLFLTNLHVTGLSS